MESRLNGNFEMRNIFSHPMDLFCHSNPTSDKRGIDLVELFPLIPWSLFIGSQLYICFVLYFIFVGLHQFFVLVESILFWYLPTMLSDMNIFGTTAVVRRVPVRLSEASLLRNRSGSNLDKCGVRISGASFLIFE